MYSVMSYLPQKLTKILISFALITYVCFLGKLHHEENNALTVPTVQYHEMDKSKTFSWLTEEEMRKRERLQKSESLVRSEAAEAAKLRTKLQTTENSIGPCPETPPKLVGPLLVRFNPRRTLDWVRDKVSAPLQIGGRYKPQDCIAKQKVAIIIPFRNRHEHLKHWLYYLHPILIKQQVDYGVYVINQDGEGVFNKAKLMNVGFAEALKEYDYDCFVFSDVDLAPMDDRNLYRCFDNPRHLSVAIDKFKFKFPYGTLFGGVTSLSKTQFLKINGFSNTYWGWGGEDDDMARRIFLSSMTISRPDLKVGRYKMIKHDRDSLNEPNPENVRKLQKTRWTMSKDGIRSLNYTVQQKVKDKLYTFITVDIQAPLSLAHSN